MKNYVLETVKPENFLRLPHALPFLVLSTLLFSEAGDPRSNSLCPFRFAGECVLSSAEITL